MKISVIVPVFNCAEYLPSCVDSILSQTHQNLEVILVDDGSTDNSPLICEQYQQLDSRVHVIYQPNSGVSAARNSGLAFATGELITFVDGDDTIDQDMYELLVRVMQENNADISHCGYKRIDNKSTLLVHDTKQLIIQSRVDALRYLIEGKLFIGSVCNKLYRRSMLEGLRLDEKLKNNEDILFNFEVFRRANVIAFADYAKYNYLAHNGTSACFSLPSIKKSEDTCMVNEIIYRGVQETNLKDIAGERYLRSLSSYFRVADDKQTRKKLRRKIWTVYKELKYPCRNVKITALLIRYTPRIYCILYHIYDRFRTPYWEATI